MDRSRALGRLLAMATGVVAIGAGVALAHVVALIIEPTASPVLAVGGLFIDLTPEWLKSFAIERFGTNDKAVLLLGIAATLLAISAAIGLVASRHRKVGCTLAGVVGLLAVGAAATRAGGGPLALVPGLLGTAVSIAVLAWLSAPSREVAGDTGMSRRRLLGATLLIGAGAVVIGGLSGFLGSRLRDLEPIRQALRLPRPAEPAPPLPATVEVPVDGVTPFRVPSADFYRVDTTLIVPTVDPESWRLTVSGMVERPYSLTFDELLAMPMVERDITLTCVSNEVGGPYIGNAVWLGVPLREILRQARVDRASDQLLSRSVDGWTAGTPMAVALDNRDALIAVGMNGEPLPVEHGFPARMVIPGLYGYVSATKWLTELHATTYSADEAYWTQRGWAIDGQIRTMARVEVPRPLSTIPPGPAVIAGTAWAQHRGIDGVEVQVDDGPWEAARLGDVPSVDTWRQWWTPWTAEPGRHVVRARATDGEGRVQPSERLTPFPSGAQGWHEVVVNVS